MLYFLLIPKDQVFCPGFEISRPCTKNDIFPVASPVHCQAHGFFCQEHLGIFGKWNQKLNALFWTMTQFFFILYLLFHFLLVGVIHVGIFPRPGIWPLLEVRQYKTYITLWESRQTVRGRTIKSILHGGQLDELWNWQTSHRTILNHSFLFHA